jgi:hypothetical protein
MAVREATRFDLKYGMGGLSRSKLMTNIELYGTQVVPLVRDVLTSGVPPEESHEHQRRGSPCLTT